MDPTVVGYICIAATIIIIMIVLIVCITLRYSDDLLTYLAKRAQARVDITRAISQRDVEVAKINKDKEVEKARLENEYFKNITGVISKDKEEPHV